MKKISLLLLSLILCSCGRASVFITSEVPNTFFEILDENQNVVEKGVAPTIVYLPYETADYSLYKKYTIKTKIKNEPPREVFILIDGLGIAGISATPPMNKSSKKNIENQKKLQKANYFDDYVEYE